MSFVQGMSDGFRASWNYITEWYKAGWSGTKILETLRDYDRGYRTQTFFQDLQLLAKATESWDYMRYVARGSVPSPRLYQPSAIPLPENYRTRFQIQVIDSRTGESKTLYGVVDHASPMKRSELEEDAQRHVLGQPQYEEIEDIMPVAGWMRSELFGTY